VTLFPLAGDPTSFVLIPTFVEYWKRAQDWVWDVRARKGTWAACIAGRIRELGLDQARIGVDGLAGPLDPDGWFPHSVYEEMTGLLPRMEVVNTGDMLEKMQAEAGALDSMVNRLRPGMVFALNIDLVNPVWRNGGTGCVFAETIIITEGAAKRMHTFSTDFQIVPV
jgi:hypothetical protein